MWKQPHRIKCFHQFRISKRDTDCFEHLHEENTKLSANVSVSHAWIFLSISGFYGFYRSEGWGRDRDVDVLVLLNSDLRNQ